MYFKTIWKFQDALATPKFNKIRRTLSHAEASYSNKVLKIEYNINRFSKADSFEGYIAANCHDTSYPFSFT